MPAVNRWVLLVLLTVTGFLAFSGWSFYRAAYGTSAVTDRDYYSHGLRFNQTLLEQQAAASLGWRTRVVLDNRQLQVTVQDQHRQPVTSARATLTLSGSRAGEPLRLPLEEGDDGRYRIDLPGSLRGEQTAQFELERDGARLSQRLLLALP